MRAVPAGALRRDPAPVPANPLPTSFVPDTAPRY